MTHWITITAHHDQALRLGRADSSTVQSVAFYLYRALVPHCCSNFTMAWTSLT